MEHTTLNVMKNYIKISIKCFESGRAHIILVGLKGYHDQYLTLKFFCQEHIVVSFAVQKTKWPVLISDTCSKLVLDSASASIKMYEHPRAMKISSSTLKSSKSSL